MPHVVVTKSWLKCVYVYKCLDTHIFSFGFFTCSFSNGNSDSSCLLTAMCQAWFEVICVYFLNLILTNLLGTHLINAVIFIPILWCAIRGLKRQQVTCLRGHRSCEQEAKCEPRRSCSRSALLALYKTVPQLWPAWLGGLNTGLWTKGRQFDDISLPPSPSL